MITASFSGLLRIIFWLLLISFLVRLVARLALPYVIRKASEKMNEQHRSQHSSQPQRPPGDVRVETKPGQQKSNGPSDNDGEYVDFKEIKE
jgi:hypothetical protein